MKITYLTPTLKDLSFYDALLCASTLTTEDVAQYDDASSTEDIF